MRTLATPLVLLLGTFLGAVSAFCQEDQEGATDIPYFTRMPNFYLDLSNNRDFDEYKFFDGKNIIIVEGKVYQSEYRLKEGVTNPPSDLQIRRNYINAIKAKGGTVLAEAAPSDFGDDRDGHTLVTAKFVKDGKEIWFEVFPLGGDWIRLTVLEKLAMKQDITATDMLEAITKDGYVALDIHFDTGKAVIKEESRGVVGQIVILLKDNPSLKLSVEGHTDNVGDARGNKKLSEQRAKAVVDALVAAGTAADRLKAAGYGQEKPVADNRTEEGRAKNRRVELVKQ
jgi:outer membrane protein OmpA-like peptidoglycan-associated protein